MTESNYALQDGLYDVKLSTQVTARPSALGDGRTRCICANKREGYLWADGGVADPIRVRIRASAFGYGGRTQGSYDQALTPKIRLYER